MFLGFLNLFSRSGSYYIHSCWAMKPVSSFFKNMFTQFEREWCCVHCTCLISQYFLEVSRVTKCYICIFLVGEVIQEITCTQLLFIMHDGKLIMNESSNLVNHECIILWQKTRIPTKAPPNCLKGREPKTILRFAKMITRWIWMTYSISYKLMVK